MGYPYDAARFAGMDLPVLLLQGGARPDWAKEPTRALHEAIPGREVAVLEGHGLGRPAALRRRFSSPSDRRAVTLREYGVIINMSTPRELQTLYGQGKNIAQLLRKEYGLQGNTSEIIEVAYDLQSGSYVAAMENEEMGKYKRAYTSELAKTILSLCKPISILEAGVGEATTLSGVVQNIGYEVDSFGFDLSWSRIAHAKRWLLNKGVTDATLCTGNLFDIPFADNSIDVVYTSHSIEPNGGNEKAILQELFRVTRKFLILLEPGYELASEEAKQRMDMHGYCKDLKGISETLGYHVLAHKMFPVTSNPLNPTAITIIEKQAGGLAPLNILACPKYKTRLEDIGGMLFSPEGLVVYPVVDGIPCLRIENGIFASKYKEIVEAR